MFISALLISAASLLIIGFLIYKLQKKTILSSQTAPARGSVTTITFDSTLNIVDVTAPLNSKICGLPATSIIGQNINKMADKLTGQYKNHANLIAKNIAEVATSKSDTFFEHTTKNQDNSIAETMYYAEYLADGSIICQVVNISREKRISGCGKCVNEVMASGINNLPVGVYSKLIGNDSKYVFANKMAKKFCQCNELDEFQYWDLELETETNAKIIATNESLTYVKTLYGPDGEPKQWLNISKSMHRTDNKGDYIITSIADISERKKREIELEAAKLYLGMAIGAGDISVWSYNIKTDYLKALYGEIYVEVGSTLDDCMNIIHPESKAVFDRAYENLLTKKSKTEEVILRLCIPNNMDHHYLKSSMTAALSPSGKVIDIIGTQKDITATQIKKMELQSIRNSLDMAIVAGNIVAWEYNLASAKFRILYGDKSSEYFNTDIENHSVAEALNLNMHHSDIDRYQAFIHNLIAKGGRDSIIVRGADNNIYFEMTVSTVKNDLGVVDKLLGTRRDISDIQRQKIELEKTQKNLSLAMEAGGVSVWIYDIEKEIFFTLQGDTIAGQGLTMADNLALLHPEDASVCQNLINNMASGKQQTGSAIYRFKANDIEGGYRYYEARKIAVKEGEKVKYLTGTQKEVTNEQFYQQNLEHSNMIATQAMDELQKINRYNQLILDNTNSGLAYITPDFKVRWENVSTLDPTNKYPSMLKTGELCYKTSKGVDTPCPDCIVVKAIESGKRERKEVVLKYGDVIDIMATPVYDKDLTLDGVVLRIDDITKDKQVILELQQAKEKAESSDRFKSTFLANMSHEIRTPLNAIVGFSALMADVETEEEKHEYNRIISMNNELLLKLINDILDLSKIEAGYINIKKTDFDIAELFSELTSSFSPRMPSGVKFICDNPYQHCMVHFDRNRLIQVITNFMSNAIKFTKSGHIKLGYLCTEDQLHVYVSDTGIGIAPEKLNNVFERFEKLNDFAQGTGLGLSICKSILDTEGGDVGVESTLGEGSIFWATAPCKISAMNTKLETTETESTEKHNEEPKSTTRKSILVAEDTDSNYKLIWSILKNEYDLTRAINGLEVVSAINNSDYDIVLMDMKMPVMGGLEATAKIRQTNSTIPIIALTANVFDSDRQTALDAGCTDFLAKPINKAKLLDVLRKY